MKSNNFIKKTKLRQAEKMTWRLVITTTGSVLGAVVPGLIGGSPTASLIGTTLVGLLSAIFTGEGPATRAKALVALAFALLAVTLTISGFTLADKIHGKSVLGNGRYTFPVPLPSDVKEQAASAPESLSPTSSRSPVPNLPLNSNSSAPGNPNLQPNRTLLPIPIETLPPSPTLRTIIPTEPPLTPANTVTPTITTVPTITPPPPTTTPNSEQIISQGPVILSADPGQDSSVEMDWWRSVNDRSGDLQMDQNRIFTLLGARLSVIDDSPTPTRARCAQVQNWTTEVSFPTLHVGSQLCAKSREYRYATIKIDYLPTSEGSRGRLGFYGITWTLRFSP